MNTTHTTPEMRDAFMAFLLEPAPELYDASNTDAAYIWQRAWQAAQSQPAPPAFVGDKHRHVICVCPDCVKPAEPVTVPSYEYTDGTLTLEQEVLDAVGIYERTQPEDGESWESWYEAAFGLLRERLRSVFAEWDTRALSAPAPAPPVPQTMQEIMRLIHPYVRDCINAAASGAEPTFEQLELDREKCETTLKPLEAALTALVEKNHRLKFELAGVNAMRRPLIVEQLRNALKPLADCHLGPDGYEHLGITAHFQTEDVIKAKRAMDATHGIEPEQGEVK